MVVGPEAYLEGGLVNLCADAGIAAFGPSRAAARIETSKSWAKRQMELAGVPTSGYRVFTKEEEAKDHLRAADGPFVVKADGIAAGKGVLVTQERHRALRFALECLRSDASREGEPTVLVEERLEGEEVSLFAFVAGEDVLPLGLARDYKRAHDGDDGPNTGGMGAVSPGDLPPGFLEEATDSMVRPIARRLAASGVPYYGVLYAGLMLTRNGPYVVEYNARFGDPEAQVLLPRLRTDLLELLWGVATGAVAGLEVALADLHTCGVTIASEGYPTRGRPLPQVVEPQPPIEGATLYHAGTGTDAHGRLVAKGGRVFTAVGEGASAEEARERAYALARTVRFEGAWFRGDIGGKGG